MHSASTYRSSERPDSPIDNHHVYLSSQEKIRGNVTDPKQEEEPRSFGHSKNTLYKQKNTELSSDPVFLVLLYIYKILNPHTSVSLYNGKRCQLDNRLYQVRLQSHNFANVLICTRSLVQPGSPHSVNNTLFIHFFNLILQR